MKLNKKTVVLLAIFTLLSSIISSCSQKIRFQSSVLVPAASGYVRVKKDNNRNYTISIQIDNLAEVTRLNPPRKAYIVWMQSENQGLKNMGRIKSSEKTFSKALSASFTSVSPIKPMKIFITAEDDETVQFPNTQIIFQTNDF